MKGLLKHIALMTTAIISSSLLAGEGYLTSTNLKNNAYNALATLKVHTDNVAKNVKEAFNNARKQNYLGYIGSSLSDSAASIWQIAENNPEETAMLALFGAAACYLGYLDYKAQQKHQLEAEKPLGEDELDYPIYRMMDYDLADITF